MTVSLNMLSESNSDLRTSGCNFRPAQNISFTIDGPNCDTTIILIFVVYLNTDVSQFD